MNESTEDREKRLAELKREVTKRGFDRHASKLTGVSELPLDLQSPAMMEMVADETIQTIIVFPPHIQRGWDYIPKQAMLFTSTGVIHILASIWADQEPKITYLKSCDLMYMRVTLVLLYGLLEIVAHGQESPNKLNVEFNTVAWTYLFHPLQQLLQGTKKASDTLNFKVPYSPTMHRDFEGMPFKFSNGLKIYGLLPGEQLEELVFQPSLRKRWMLVFRRNVIANTLLILSTNYMVVIQEELDVEQGWVVSYIPKDRITEMQNRPCGLWSELIVSLKLENQSLEYGILLRNEAMEAWHTRWIRHGGQWQDIRDQTEGNRSSFPVDKDVR